VEHWLATPAKRYLFATLVTALALLVSVIMQAVTGGRVLIMPFFPAVIAVALYAGVGPAMGCALLAILVALTTRARTSETGTLSASDLWTISSFAVSAALIITIAARVRRAEARAVLESKRADAHKTSLLALERQARQESERVGRMKDEFLSTLSHELRSPLSAIVGWAQVLHTQPLAAQVARGLEVIERNARAQTRIIDDLLDSSRIVAGKAKLDVRAVDLQNTVSSAIVSVQPAANAKQIKIEKIVANRVGPAKADPGRLQQIMWNLLSNAVKFTPVGGRVVVNIAQVDNHAQITVSDTGMGIKPDFLPFVFDRFRQADASTTREHQGLGLGLSICKQLVEMHGGTIRVSSAGEGKGTTFTVALPLDDGRSTVETVPTSERTVALVIEEISAADLPSLAGLHVLVVEDQADTRDVLAMHLRSAGCEVTLAESARQALDALRKHRFDVLVSDIGMPHEDGYELIRKVRALPPESGGALPAVALTAFVRAEDRRRAILSGYHMHLAKPVELPELVTMVAALAGRLGNANAPEPVQSGG
jgi:signal transduction histidine kinase/ActR/RegA family two-component response regulator